MIAFCDHPSNEVLLLEPGGSPRVLTGSPDLRYGDLRLHPAGRLLLAALVLAIPTVLMGGTLPAAARSTCSWVAR